LEKVNFENCEEEEERCGIRLLYSHSVQLALGMTPVSLIGVKGPKRGVPTH